MNTRPQIKDLLVPLNGNNAARMIRLDTESGSFDFGTVETVGGNEIFTVVNPAQGCGPLPGYDPDTAEELPDLEELAALIQNPPVDLAGIQTAYDNATEKLLNDRAAGWGYVSMSRATTYAQSTNPVWAAEAAALIAHRDAVWLAGYAIAQDVIAGNRTVPTLAEYLAELPAAPVRPV